MILERCKCELYALYLGSTCCDYLRCRRWVITCLTMAFGIFSLGPRWRLRPLQHISQTSVKMNRFGIIIRSLLHAA